MTLERSLEQSAQAIRQADALLIAAGAGMGVDSGLPDFRGTEGFWNAYPPFRDAGLTFQDLAQPGWFRQDPSLAWGFYGHRLNLYRRTVPHAGFALLRAWMETMPAGGFVFTSNVDGQFQKAGFPADRIVECHGCIHTLQCARSCTTALWSAEETNITVDNATFRAEPPWPTCPNCGGIARPNILMFGDARWISDRTDLQEEAFEDWLAGLQGAKLAIVECGAGTAIPTVRRTAEEVARRDHASLIRINVREADGDRDVLSIPLGAQEALQRIDALL